MRAALILAVSMSVFALGCEDEKRARIGDPCSNDTDCESLVCDPDLGKCTDPISCESSAVCEDTDPCTKDLCENGRCIHEPSCQKKCRCADEGVKLVPDPCDWGDATKCSAWESIQHVLGGDPNAAFNDGTRACWTDNSCCLILRCP